MNVERSEGEPVSAGRRDPADVHRQGLRDAITIALLFIGIVLANGIVFLLVLGISGQ